MRISDWSSDVCSSDLRDPQHGRDTLATPELQPDRIEMAQERADRRERSCVLEKMAGEQHDHRALAGVEQQRCRRQSLAPGPEHIGGADVARSEEHTSELQSLMRISYAVFCLKKQKNNIQERISTTE